MDHDSVSKEKSKRGLLRSYSSNACSNDTKPHSSQCRERRNDNKGGKRLGSARLRQRHGSRSPPHKPISLSAVSKALLSPQLPPRSRGTKMFFSKDDDGHGLLSESSQLGTQNRHLLRPEAAMNRPTVHQLLSPLTRASERKRVALGSSVPSLRVVRKQLKNQHRPSSRQITAFPLHLDHDFRKQPRTAFGSREVGQVDASLTPPSMATRSNKPLVNFLRGEFERPPSRQREPTQSLHLFSRPTVTMPRMRTGSFESLSMEEEQTLVTPPLSASPSPPQHTETFRSIVGPNSSDSDSDSDSLQNSILEDGANGFLSPPGLSLQSGHGGRNPDSDWMKRRPGTAFQPCVSMDSTPSKSPDHSPEAPNAELSSRCSAATFQLQRPQTNASGNQFHRPNSKSSSLGIVDRPQHVSLLDGDSDDDEPIRMRSTFSFEGSGFPSAPDNDDHGDDFSDDSEEALTTTSMTSAFLNLFGT